MLAAVKEATAVEPNRLIADCMTMVTEGSNGKLQCHRNSHRQLMAALLTMQPPVLSCRGECRHFGVNVDQTQNCRYTLGKDGSAGGTCNTHFKVNDKYKVKNYIKHCGKYQEK